jgi:PIN domain nuclease of toxin-antitoxin system
MVWLLEDSPRLSPSARAALTDASARLVVPALVLAEIKYLYSRKRIPIDLAAVLAYIQAATNCQVCPLDEQVVAHLPASLDIHDGVIVATAIMVRDDWGDAVALIIRDAAIQASGLVPVVW